jgi:iron complex outermembrane receptor protein
MNWSGSFIQAKRTIESKAAFGQAVWHVNDRVRLTAGVRYTDDTKQDQGGRNVTFKGYADCLTAEAGPAAAIPSVATPASSAATAAPAPTNCWPCWALATASATTT